MEVDRLAFYGDSLLRHALSAHVMRSEGRGARAGVLSVRRAAYQSNGAMSLFLLSHGLEKAAEKLPRRGQTVAHVMGTLFEAVLALCAAEEDDETAYARGFAARWAAWCDQEDGVDTRTEEEREREREKERRLVEDINSAFGGDTDEDDDVGAGEEKQDEEDRPRVTLFASGKPGAWAVPDQPPRSAVGSKKRVPLSPAPGPAAAAVEAASPAPSDEGVAVRVLKRGMRVEVWRMGGGGSRLLSSWDVGESAPAQAADAFLAGVLGGAGEAAFPPQPPAEAVAEAERQPPLAALLARRRGKRTTLWRLTGKGEELLSSSDSAASAAGAFSRVADAAAAAARDDVQTGLMQALDAIPACPRDEQRRCLVFRCGSKGLVCQRCMVPGAEPCGTVWRECYNCAWASPLASAADRNDVMPSGALPAQFRQGLPLASLLELPPDGDAVGIPLGCPSCGGCLFIIDHCSNNFKCRIGACSKRYPCKRFLSWTCCFCKAASLFRREPDVWAERAAERESLLRRLQVAGVRGEATRKNNLVQLAAGLGMLDL